MSRAILLDAGPLGMVTHPRNNLEIKAWLENVILRTVVIWVPEIADYEVRRELLRAGKQTSIQRLNVLNAVIRYLLITTALMLRAAEFWAQIRQQGQSTAHNHALDGDVIIA